MIIDFAQDGTAQALYSDKFPLSILGAQHVERASEIKFNSENQKWTIFLPYESDFVEIEEAKGFDTYESARSMEVEWLDACRLHSIEAMSLEGRTLLKLLRGKIPPREQN